MGPRKRSRWVRETQRRGITHQMWHMLSFSGKWNIKFFENMPAPTQPGQCTEQQKKNTIAAAEARASVRYAKLCHHMQVTKKWCLTSSQLSLVARLRDGSLEDEAQKLTPCKHRYNKATRWPPCKQRRLNRRLHANCPLRLDAA